MYIKYMCVFSKMLITYQCDALLTVFFLRTLISILGVININLLNLSWQCQFTYTFT